MLPVRPRDGCATGRLPDLSRFEPRDALVEAVRRLDPAYFYPDAMVLMGNVAGEATRTPELLQILRKHAVEPRVTLVENVLSQLQELGAVIRRHRQAHHRHHVLRKLLRRLLPRQQQEEDLRDGRRRAVAGDRDQTEDPRASTVRAVIPRVADQNAESFVRRSLSSRFARWLYLSEATVKTHVGRIMAKLGLRDRVHV